MRAGLPPPSPALATKLDRVHRAFEHWRRTRRARARIPARLWALAVAHAREAGVHATARRLRLNYYALKERVQGPGGGRAPGASAAPAFVEVVTASLPPAGGSECVIDLADARGATMRILLKSPTPPDLTALSQGFWRGRA
jgi:hypothetical protein